MHAAMIKTASATTTTSAMAMMKKTSAPAVKMVTMPMTKTMSRCHDNHTCAVSVERNFVHGSARSDSVVLV